MAPVHVYSARGLDLGELTDLVRELAASPDRWRPLVRFPRTQRYYTRLIAEPTVEAWLLTWLPEQTTDLHDHGGSAAAFTVVEGAVHEWRADHRGGLTRLRRHPGPVHALAPRVVHDVRHAGTGPAVSIHAYSPPLTSMTYYAAGAGGLRRLRTVDSEAWG